MYNESDKQQHKLRVPFIKVANQERTNIFIMEVWKGQEFVGKRVITMKPQNSLDNGVSCTAKEMNDAKREISEEGGYYCDKTTFKILDVFKDENGFLYYWRWFDDIGNVKTLLT